MLSAVETNMDRMRLECAFRYFCSCVTHIGNSAKRFHWLVPRLLPPFGEKWPAKQGANYSIVRWPMKRGRVALEEKNFPVLYWINQKALRVQISSCLFFFNNTKARKIVRTLGNVFFFFSPIVCDGLEGLSGMKQWNREALTGNLQSTS